MVESSKSKIQKESGAKPMWKDGQISFDIQEETSGLFAGQMIRGTVMVHQIKGFKTTALQIGLWGSEETYFRKFNGPEASQKYSYCLGAQEIVNAKWIIKKFDIGFEHEAGQYEYPFEFVIPEWLPSSFLFQSELDKTQMSIRYELRSQFIPLNVEDWAQHDQNFQISQFRGMRSIFINHKVGAPSVLEMSQSIKSQVGGVFGFGASSSTTQVFVTQNEYYLGEKASVRIICDNSKCDKAVKSFKLKISRKSMANNTKQQMSAVQGGYITSKKLPGCKAKETVERILEIGLPMPDIEQGRLTWDAGECNKKRAFPERVGATCAGRLITVEYNLLVFVKHDSWNEFGEGNCISIPLKVNQPPIKSCFSPPVKVKPETWNPKRQELTQLELMCPIDIWYFSMVMVPKEGEWKDKQQPFIIEKEQVQSQDKEFERINATMIDLQASYKNDPEALEVIQDLDQQLEEDKRRQEDQYPIQEEYHEDFQPLPAVSEVVNLFEQNIQLNAEREQQASLKQL